jgi:hypothetical protein
MKLIGRERNDAFDVQWLILPFLAIVRMHYAPAMAHLCRDADKPLWAIRIGPWVVWHNYPANPLTSL